jgi:hypothetical protein
MESWIRPVPLSCFEFSFSVADPLAAFESRFVLVAQLPYLIGRELEVENSI